MTPYIVINIYIIVIGVTFTFFESRFASSAVIDIKKQRFIKQYACVLLIIAMCLLAGLRGNFTADYEAYYQLFYEIKEQNWSDILQVKDYVEVGYRVLNKFISYFFSNGNWALFAITTIMVLLVACTGYHYAASLWLFYLFWVSCGFYYLSFNMFRQALAGAVIFAGTKYLIDKKIVKYIIVILLASTIHTTALFMLVALPLLLQKVSIRNILRTIGIGGVALLLANPIIAFIQRYRYEGYEYGMGQGRITAIVVPLFLMVFIAWACGERYIDICSEQNRVLINATLIHGIICIGILRVEQISRLGYFFSTYTLLLCTNCLSAIKEDSLRRTIKLFAAVLLTAYVFVWLSGTGYENYHTFLG